MKPLLLFLLLPITFSCDFNSSKESIQCDSKYKGDLGIYETYSFQEIKYDWENAKKILSLEFEEGFDSTGLNILRNTGLVNLGYVTETSDKKRISDILQRSDIKALFKPSLKFMWSAKKEVIDYPGKNKGWFLYACKIPLNGKAKINRSHISRATTGYDQMNSEITIDLMMSSEGKDIWTAMTQENIGKVLTITVDGLVFSAPIVRGEINGGRTQISGGFSREEANKLACVLNRAD